MLYEEKDEEKKEGDNLKRTIIKNRSYLFNYTRFVTFFICV